MARPNLLLVTADQMLADCLGVLKPVLRTPNLDRLAARGTLFRRAYCPNPTCTPTRCSILTGLWPSSHGAYTLGCALDPDADTFGDHLRAAGYTTGLVGKAHFQPLHNGDDGDYDEAYPTLRDLDHWRRFNDDLAPWYGFDHVEICRQHGDESHVGGHYALWLEERGLHDWRDYFQPVPPPHDGLNTPTAGSRTVPRVDGPGYGWRAYEPWELPEPLHYSHWTAERTCSFIDAAGGRPWACWASFHDPHPPYLVPEPWFSMYDPADMDAVVGTFAPGEFDDMPPPHRMTRDPAADFDVFRRDFANHGYHPHVPVSDELLRRSAAVYCGMISLMDTAIGRVLDHLDTRGELDDTLVVFTSDHGHLLGHHGLIAKGAFHYEELIRVPMIASWPAGGVPAGRRGGGRGGGAEALQTLVDLPATLLDAAGVAVPTTMQAVSQLDVWRGDDGAARPGVIVENHHTRGAVHLRTLVTPTHKLTVYRDRPGWGEVVDLVADPGERVNLWDRDPALRGRLMQELVQADLARERTGSQRVSHA